MFLQANTKKDMTRLKMIVHFYKVNHFKNNAIVELQNCTSVLERVLLKPSVYRSYIYVSCGTAMLKKQTT